MNIHSELAPPTRLHQLLDVAGFSHDGSHSGHTLFLIHNASRTHWDLVPSAGGMWILDGAHMRPSLSVLHRTIWEENRDELQWLARIFEIIEEIKGETDGTSYTV